MASLAYEDASQEAGSIEFRSSTRAFLLKSGARVANNSCYGADGGHGGGCYRANCWVQTSEQFD